MYDIEMEINFFNSLKKCTYRLCMQILGIVIAYILDKDDKTAMLRYKIVPVYIVYYFDTLLRFIMCSFSHTYIA